MSVFFTVLPACVWLGNREADPFSGNTDPLPSQEEIEVPDSVGWGDSAISSRDIGPGTGGEPGSIGDTGSGEPAQTSSHAPEGYSLVWEDDFAGPGIDTASWVVASLRDPATGDLVPGAAGDHLLNSSYAGYITEEDTFIENGALVLRNQKRTYEGQSPAGTYSYTSGWAMSMHRVHFNKGYVEIRAKFPSGDKVWPAMWLISEELRWCPEWDMWEYFGYREDQPAPYDNMGTHLCYGAWPDQQWSSHFIQGYDAQHACGAWHVYGFEWTADEARWFLDGEQVHSVEAASLGSSQHLWPDEEMYIVLNNGQKTSSPDEDTVWPNRLEVDFIRLFQKE
jgi:beta-glucanase (GH16 family)